MRVLLSAIVCTAVAALLVAAGCPPDYMVVERYGREQCNQKIWRDFQLYRGTPKRYMLPSVQLEGWTEWKMCINGRLGPSAKKYQVRFLAQSSPLTIVKAIYGKANKMVNFLEFRDGKRETNAKETPDVFPAAIGKPFSFSAHMNGSNIEYTFCDEAGCYQHERTMLQDNLFYVHLTFQAQISVLNLWCL